MSKLINARHRLDRLFVLDATLSCAFGTLALIVPHNLVAAVAEHAGTTYVHSTHEALRLYACTKIAMGRITFGISGVDDGRLRRAATEAFTLCYIVQAGVILRAQLTDRHVWINWLLLSCMLAFAGAYANFRFFHGGDLIKVYELPNKSSKSEY